MIARGNLRGCLEAMLHAYHVQHYPLLILLHNPTGNYYTAVTEEELNRIKPTDQGGIHRLVFRGTHKELLTFSSTRQLDLIPTKSLSSTQPDSPPELGDFKKLGSVL